MPREQRLLLSAKLKEFDALSPAEQAEVREFDRTLAAEPESEREGYYAVLRRYHLWVRSLPESQRERLNATPPEKRMAMVAKLRAEEQQETPRDSLIQLADFGSVSPFDLARRIKIWMSLNEAQKSAVSKLPEGERRPRLQELGKELKIGPIGRPSVKESTEIYERAIQMPRYAWFKSLESKKQDPKKTEIRKQAELKHRLVDHHYFVEHPSGKVRPDNLLLFDRALPRWVRDGFDSLPPEEARRRLTILYRLVFPEGTEIKPSGSAKGAAAKSAPAAPAAAKGTGAAVDPF